MALALKKIPQKLISHYTNVTNGPFRRDILKEFSNCENKRTAHEGWQPETDHMNNKHVGSVGVMTLYIQVPTVSRSRSSRRDSGSWEVWIAARECPWRNSDENFSLKKQKRKALVMEFVGTEKVPKSFVSLSLSLSLSLSRLRLISTLWIVRRDIYFYKEMCYGLIIPSLWLFIHHGYTTQRNQTKVVRN